jgi:hypothetical protein
VPFKLIKTCYIRSSGQGEIVGISIEDGAQYGCAECAGEIYISELATISAMYSKRKMNIAHLTAGREMKEGTD